MNNSNYFKPMSAVHFVCLDLIISYISIAFCVLNIYWESQCLNCRGVGGGSTPSCFPDPQAKCPTNTPGGHVRPTPVILHYIAVCIFTSYVSGIERQFSNPQLSNSNTGESVIAEWLLAVPDPWRRWLKTVQIIEDVLTERTWKFQIRYDAKWSRLIKHSAINQTDVITNKRTLLKCSNNAR